MNADIGGVHCTSKIIFSDSISKLSSLAKPWSESNTGTVYVFFLFVCLFLLFTKLIVSTWHYKRCRWGGYWKALRSAVLLREETVEKLLRLSLIELFFWAGNNPEDVDEEVDDVQIEVEGSEHILLRGQGVRGAGARPQLDTLSLQFYR